MTVSRIRRSRCAPWVVALAVPFVLIAPASADTASTTSTSTSTFSDGTCPAEDGWTKVDADSGGNTSSTGNFGTISSTGSTVTYTLNTGYVMDICVKAGDNNSGGGFVVHEVQGSGVLSAPLGKDVSHLSFRATTNPDPDPDPDPDPEPPFAPDGALTVVKTAAGTLDRAHSWTLAKTVDPASQAGVAGQTLSAGYTITADKTTTDSNHWLGGTITVSNSSSNTDVVVDVTDSIAEAVVDCDPTEGAQSTGIPVARKGSVTCTYSLTPLGAVTSNTATATATATSPAGHDGHFGTVWHTAAVSYTPSVTGDDSVVLDDAMFPGIGGSISEDTTRTATGSYTCPEKSSAYVNRQLSNTVNNTATLTGTGTALQASATTTYNCTYPYVDETATGSGPKWSASVKNLNNNWFMWTPVASLTGDSGAPLIAGQHHTAGTVRLAGNVLTVTMNDGFRFDPDMLENLKVQPLRLSSTGTCAPTKYVSPGSYSLKTTASGNAGSITVATGSAICGYAIHVDTERHVG